MRKNRFLWITLLLFTTFGYTFSQRAVLPLDGSRWQFCEDPDSIGYLSWYRGLPESRQVNVPHTWNVEAGNESYHGLGWYEKDIDIPRDWKGKRVRLHFDAVYRDMILYMNGKKVGRNTGLGYTPFSFDITSFVKYGVENKMVVSVSNKFSEYSFPYKAHFDWPNDGGIIRPVKLIATGVTSIRYAHIKPEINFQDSSATASIHIKTWEEDVRKATFTLTFSEYKTGKVILSETKEIKQEDGIFKMTVSFKDIKPWHFDSPELYVMQVDIHDADGYSDTYASRFGFREIEIRGHQFFLNKEPVRLPGVEYMAGSNPLYGMAETEEVMLQAVKSMKELNCVITRFHWQQDSRILDMMDEYGVLVQQEIPWWQAPGNLSPKLEMLAKQHIDAMIERDYNRPSIFSWGVSNEVFYNTDKDIYRRVIEHARKWDSNKFVTVVSNEIFDRLENDESLLADIPTWNDYVGTWHGNHREETPSMLDLINKRALKGRPLLITEHGLCEPRFVGGDARRVTEMTYHYDQWAKNDYIMGCVYFSLNDYRTHVGESGYGRYAQRVHGLTDLWFNRKPSFAVYQALAAPLYFESVQQSASGTEAEVNLVVKNTLPSYTLQNYKIVWKTSTGNMKEIILPVLNPGDKYSLSIDKLNPWEKIDVRIIRPTGFEVISYH